MASATPDKSKADALPSWIGPAVVAVVGGGTAFYFWLLFTRWAHAEQWGNFGDAVGPFVALLNAGALFAALYSVRLQRQELALQREELAANREVMKEQQAEFERTAKAQEALAESQQRLAKAQEAANSIRFGLRLAMLEGEFKALETKRACMQEEGEPVGLSGDYALAQRLHTELTNLKAMLKAGLIEAWTSPPAEKASDSSNG